MIRLTKIRSYERGLHFRDGELIAVLQPGRHFFMKPFQNETLDVVSLRTPQLSHPDLDTIVKSGLLNPDEIEVIDLKDDQRALVRIDKRFHSILGPGLHAFWKTEHEVEVEVIDATAARFESTALAVIMKDIVAKTWFDEFIVEEGYVGLFFKNGEFIEELKPSRYAFWKDVAKLRLFKKDMRLQMADVSGQEIMTSDKVTLRLNALVTFKITNALRAVTTVDDVGQAIYREAQLTLREVVGTRDLEALLADKNAVSADLIGGLAGKTTEFGVETIAFGIRDIILPGDMKEILNKVIEAKKTAEANFIARREEVAAMRSQANTAKMLESSPALMRLRELETLEKIAQNTNLSVLLGEEGLASKITKLI